MTTFFSKNSVALSPLFFVLFLASCASTPAVKPTATAKSAQQTHSLVGIWAMTPLRNGIANVVEFTKDGQSHLHEFNCHKKPFGQGVVEASTYTLSKNKQSIRLDTNGYAQTLKLISIDDKNMVLGQPVADYLLKFSYRKVNQIKPLCR